MCRLCTSHHSRVESELQIRLRHKRKTNRAPNKLDDEWPESIFHHVGNQSRQFSSSSSPDTPRTKVVLQSQINGISSAGGSLGTPRSGSNSRAISRHLGITWATARKPPIQVTKPAALKQEVPQLQQGLPGTASPPPAFALRVVLRVVAVV